MHVAVPGGLVGHVEVGVLLADHVDAAAGDVARFVGLAVAAREVHDDPGVGDDLDAVRGGVGLDHLTARDVEVQRGIRCAVGVFGELHAVVLRVDVHGGPRLVVLPGAPVQPRALGLVGQPRPAALGRRVGGDRHRLLDGGLVLVVDGGIELQDDRRRDPDVLTVGELELPVDLFGRGDGGEAGGHRGGLAVAADHRSGPGVRGAVAQRFGGGEGGAVAVQDARDGLALGVGERDPLKPAVLDRHAHRHRRQHVLGGVFRREGQRRLGRGLLGPGLFTRPAEAGGERAGGHHSQPERGQRTSPVDRRRIVGGAHVNQR